MFAAIVANATAMNSGFIAVAGRPNAGKSTLLNRIAGNKVSIVSHRRQTTRSVIRQISTHDDCRIAWLDTPGWQTQHGGAFNRALNVAAEWATQIADAIVFVAVANSWTTADSGLLKKLPRDKKIICALNKIDCIADRNQLLPLLAEVSQRHEFDAIIPLSAKRGDGVEALIRECSQHLPQQEMEEVHKDYPFFFAELLREKLFRALGDELPYCLGVITEVAATEKLLTVTAVIYTDRESQKPMIIGKQGGTLKRIATAARYDMEKYSGKKVYLTTRVQVADWQRDPNLLRRMKIGTL